MWQTICKAETIDLVLSDCSPSRDQKTLLAGNNTFSRPMRVSWNLCFWLLTTVKNKLKAKS
jgi:hypothetical protein